MKSSEMVRKLGYQVTFVDGDGDHRRYVGFFHGRGGDRGSDVVIRHNGFNYPIPEKWIKSIDRDADYDEVAE